VKITTPAFYLVEKRNNAVELLHVAATQPQRTISLFYGPTYYMLHMTGLCILAVG